MQYFISFLEGIVTFISPCLLPMLPVYITYFAGGQQKRGVGRTVVGALGFVLGFTIVFVLLGALAGTLGSFFNQHKTAINIISGVVIILFGLSYLGLFGEGLFRGRGRAVRKEKLNFFSTVLLGMVFSISWTPCVGAFLGSALMLAAQQGHVMQGVLMLLVYSLGLGIPFVLSAVLLEKLKTTFDFIKRHYKVINIVCGSLLVAIGLLTATGLLGRFLTLLS